MLLGRQLHPLGFRPSHNPLHPLPQSHPNVGRAVLARLGHKLVEEPGGDVVEERGEGEDTKRGIHPTRLQQCQGRVERKQDVPHGWSATPPHPRLTHRPVDGCLGKELGLGCGGDNVRLLCVPLAPCQQVGIFCVSI